METARDTHDAVTTWTLALLRTLDDAAEHLRFLVFEESWDELRAHHVNDDDALRASALVYEHALADLFRVVRASGLPVDAVDWSRLKVAWRRVAVADNLEVTLRTALGEALYAAESTPLGEHSAYASWATALTACLTAMAGTAPDAPDLTEADARLAWAYARLAHLEAHADFQAAFAACAGACAPAVTHQATLLDQPRFDLVLNAAVHWLADA